MALSFLLAALLNAAPAGVSIPVDDTSRVHLSITLRMPQPNDLDGLLADLQNAGSPRYHAWLTPEEFGERFGLPRDRYERLATWLVAGGFRVARYPNRLFLEATGTSAQARQLLGVRLRSASPAGRVVRTFDGALTLPAELDADVLRIDGLDTRTHLRHRINVTTSGQTSQALGPADLRLQYDMASLTASGHAARGLTLVVLGTQEGTLQSNSQTVAAPWLPPSIEAIQAYFILSNATAIYTPIELPNPNDDFDTPGANEEYQLDVEMQSVGAPDASAIDLVLAPASEVFEAGAQYVVNNLGSATVVSTSLGVCESEEESQNGGGPAVATSEASIFERTVKQGLSEGQTWFAAAGDTGADDCNDTNSGTGNGFHGGNATVDFPASMPEMVAMGGTQFGAAASWAGNGDLLAAVPEVVWNEGPKGASGGGESLFYSKPSWQDGVGPEASDRVRDVPDLALAAAVSTPGIAFYDCGQGQDSPDCQSDNLGAGSLDTAGGTSVASPLAAGIFALVAGQVGCRLGDIHPALYRLGGSQQDGGAPVFEDITTGNNSFADPANVVITGFRAEPGYDLASGWGSVDVAQLAAHWPPCSSSGGATSTSSGTGGSSGSSGTSASTTASGSTSSTGGFAMGGSSSGGGDGPTAATPAGCGCDSHSSEGAPFAVAGAIGLLGSRARRRKAPLRQNQADTKSI